MDKAMSPWHAPVAVDDIPDSGLHVKLEASDAVMTALAQVAGVRSLARLKAVFDVARRGKGVHVGGTVEADVGQTCVVTLEPIESQVREDIDLTFSPDVSVAAGEADGDGHSIGHMPDEEEPPEPLVGGKVDLGAVASEFLMLGIDPYPRKEGAEFAAPSIDLAGEHPFAALAVLKKPPETPRS
jgi:hypothetical protein